MTPSRAMSCPKHLQRDIPARGWELWGEAECWGHWLCPVPTLVPSRWASRSEEGSEGCWDPRVPAREGLTVPFPKGPHRIVRGVSYLPLVPDIHLACALLTSGTPGLMHFTTLGSLKMKTQSHRARSQEGYHGCTDDCINPSQAMGC